MITSKPLIQIAEYSKIQTLYYSHILLRVFWPSYQLHASVCSVSPSANFVIEASQNFHNGLTIKSLNRIIQIINKYWFIKSISNQYNGIESISFLIDA
jgi:hypothetical protein